MTATTPRSFKAPDSEWLPAKANAEARGETITDLLRRALRRSNEEIHRAEIYRDGKWWMIRVNELDAITQARNEGEVWQMARNLIGATLDIDPTTVNVELVILPGAKEE